MIILATDTSGKHGSIALARAGPTAEIEIIESVPLGGGTFSAQLVPQIASLLNNNGFTKSEIGAFIVVSGPGSFTGLRVGLAAIKALAEILQKPIVPVSLLEVVAIASAAQGKILSVLDAGRGEIYVGEYELAANHANLCSEQLLSRGEFVSLAGPKKVATPDTGMLEIFREAGVDTVPVAQPNSEMIARLGWQKLLDGKTVSPEQLEANYIRRSDAEIFAKPVAGS